MLRRPKPFPLQITAGFLHLQALRLGTAAYRNGVDRDDDGGGKKRRKARGEEEEEEGRIILHKSRGQHILTNPRVLDAIVRKAGIRPTDTVLEIGPGTGNLTLKLLQSARYVVAVEVDQRMVEILGDRVSQLGLQDKLTVICEDALKTQFPKFDLCVANIPYGISSPLVAKLLFENHNYCFRSATLLLQKEFARRLMANAGDSEFNRLAVNVKLLATVEFLMGVSKKNFFPCPKVDSSLVKILPRPEVPNVDLDEWRAFTRACFGKKNKTLGAIFKQKKKVVELLSRSQADGGTGGNTIYEEEDEGLGDNYLGTTDLEDEEVGDVKEVGLFKEKIVGILRSGGFEEKRPSKLSNDEFLHLLSLFNQAGVCFR